jgi:hypothetical protein
METLEVLSDDEQMEALRQALQEVAQGQAKPWNTVRKELGWDEPDSFQSITDLTK